MPDVYQALWRHKKLIVGLTVLFAGAAWFLTKREQPVYTASSLVRVQQSVQNTGEAFAALQTSGRLAQTYAKIAATSTIAEMIYRDLDGKVPFSAIAGHVSGSQVEDLELLVISATSSSPQGAQLIANTAPFALKDWVRSTGTLRDRVTLIQESGRPSSPSSPNLKLNVLIAVVLGLILNAGIALLIEAIGDRATSPDEVERVSGLPVLSIVPVVSRESARRLFGGVPPPKPPGLRKWVKHG
jgi:capsular polysaccharide biosynthesis protein